MLTKEIIKENTPVLYRYLVEHDLLEMYLNGINSPNVAGGYRGAEKFNRIMDPEYLCLTRCFSWLNYYSEFGRTTDWADNHRDFAMNFDRYKKRYFNKPKHIKIV